MFLVLKINEWYGWTCLTILTSTLVHGACGMTVLFSVMKLVVTLFFVSFSVTD
jgi:hypothetical protein